MAKNDKWIQKAIAHPGALRRQAKKEGAITKDGRISQKWLEKKASQGNSTVAKRARLAITLKKMRKK